MIKGSRRALCLLLAALLAPLGALATTAGREESLVLGMVSETTARLNPLQAAERDFMALSSLVYEGLVRIDDNYQPKPWLAERWEASGSGGTWTFTLRENVYFHDGRPLTSADVVATINEILRIAADEASPTRGAYASLRYMVSSATALDERRVEISTKRNNYGFIFAMDFPVLPADQLQADSPAGTGPTSWAALCPRTTCS